ILEREAALSVDHERPWRHFDHQVCGASSLLVRSTAVRSAGSAPKTMMGQCGQIVDAILGDDVDAAAVAAVAAIWAALRDVFLAPKAHAAVAAAATLNFNSD